jgi:RNA methyltransferase, TrmH family
VIEPITSASNPRIKHIRSLLANRKDRRRERLFVIEGVRLVEEAIRTGSALRMVVYDAEQLSATERGMALLREIEGRGEAYPATPVVIAAVADTVSPQGIIAVAPWPELQGGRTGIQLVLDAVQDPGNVGTLLRSAEATGVSDVVCMEGTADVFNPKVVRSAMGAHFRLPIRQDVRWDELDMALGPADHIYVILRRRLAAAVGVDRRERSQRRERRSTPVRDAHARDSNGNRRRIAERGGGGKCYSVRGRATASFRTLLNGYGVPVYN